MTHAPAALDFGVRRRSHLARKLAIWMALIGVAIVAASYTPSFFRHRHSAIAKATAWRSSGPPCPTSPPDGVMRQPTRAFRINHVVFAQASGHVACDALHANGGRGLALYPACKFISPGVVTVRSKAAHAVFYPGLGRSVTVTVEGAEARCVLEPSAEKLIRRFFW